MQEFAKPLAACFGGNDVAISTDQNHARNSCDAILPRHGKIPTLGTPIKMDGAMGLEVAPPPRLGEHTNEILARVLKYSNVKIAELHATGAIA